MIYKNAIQFNSKIRLILSDVDETIADVYKKASLEMIGELAKLLKEQRVLFLLSGGGLQSICERITNAIDPLLRHRIVIAHCMGAEVWGFKKSGELLDTPYYGIYDAILKVSQKELWRTIIQDAITKFHLKIYSPQPTELFMSQSKGNPQAVMLADRGPQITLELANSISLSQEQKQIIENELHIVIPMFHGSYDLRVPIFEYLKNRYQKGQLPLEPRFGGMFALDSIISGVDKTKAIHFIMNHNSILHNLDIDKDAIKEKDEIEIWGDKFVQKKGGPDFQMCMAVSPKVRAIDFRRENPDDIPPGYNIQLWNGKKELCEGLLEYLRSR